MAYSDEMKLIIVRDAIIWKLIQFSDWATFKTFLQGLTKDQIKTFIVSRLQSAQIEKTTIIASEQQHGVDLGELETEITNDV